MVTALVADGFAIEQFSVHFPNTGRPATSENKVKDPRVIALSHRKGWLILTTDCNMRVTHVEEFKKNQNAMVLSTANNEDGDEIWIAAVIKAKAEIQRKFKKQLRPWYAQINKQGKITVCCTILPDRPTTRRSRPKEK